MGRGQRDPALERRWRERLAEWTSSGLSVREFCLRQGLLETAFYYWRRELRARDVAAASRSSASQSRVSRSRVSQRPLTKKSPPTFVPVTVIPDATVSVEVRCPSGHVVLLSSYAAASLAALFAALAPQASLARGSQAREAQPC